ncbi:hypothetical protein CEUSTIGMA_g3109.t1 [Chlamydomonas eustigma]|uniref:Mitochondrial import inner membrane translocase subunit TIM50 n=1 Tax=Chlamydomonas eustigma TaxID=1157962 RepID=A0A250WY04_9CHLO|nr:hypothetical protein CEUSTIGMA_g3109.t1 [Chlamydomonas eustigma]|eukprot:GAX75665.1 hypothetical protein CEUSTIGMA_g3109.t1 [Chlamydomonas eustigma]
MECGILEQSTDAGCRGPQVVSFQAAHTNHTTLLPPPPPSGKKTLVLDLDATLIDTLHSNQEGRCDPDFIYTDSSGCRAKIWKRPHLLEFLQAVSKDFEVVLFTAAGQRHADAVLSHLDPNGTLIHHRLYGHHTVPCPQWSWVKDLSKLGRDLSQTLIVDDCEAAVLFQRDNWVSIPAFSQWNMDCKEERALLDILTFLQNKVLPAADVREALALHENLSPILSSFLPHLLDQGHLMCSLFRHLSPPLKRKESTRFLLAASPRAAVWRKLSTITSLLKYSTLNGKAMDYVLVCLILTVCRACQ